MSGVRSCESHSLFHVFLLLPSFIRPILFVLPFIWAVDITGHDIPCLSKPRPDSPLGSIFSHAILYHSQFSPIPLQLTTRSDYLSLKPTVTTSSVLARTVPAILLTQAGTIVSFHGSTSVDVL